MNDDEAQATARFGEKEEGRRDGGEEWTEHRVEMFDHKSNLTVKKSVILFLMKLSTILPIKRDAIWSVNKVQLHCQAYNLLHFGTSLEHKPLLLHSCDLDYCSQTHILPTHFIYMMYFSYKNPMTILNSNNHNLR